MPQRVARGVAGAFEEVDAAHELAPADDLADEPLDRVERRPARPPFRLGPAADLERVEQPEVHVGRDDRVVQIAVRGEHRVLIGAEIGKVKVRK
jgi:hypothetical protein